MRRAILYALGRLIVLIIAVAAYLLLLPAQISTASGFSVSLPEFVRFTDVGLAFPEPINWAYVLWLPVPLLIVIVGFEIVRLLLGRR
ncbi:MAG: hypothetical protein RML95_05995 [Anaerolineae bacterium]|nr:hypothetical protein [Anaerolineae bacterium]MDW8298870.1 hypothetical protein [Anaerolineae bacterium]